MGLFEKLKRGLTKTTNLLKTDVRDLFKSEGRLIDDGFLDEMRAILFKTDMGYDSVEEIVTEVSTKMRGRVVTLEEVIATWKQKLSDLMAQDSSPIKYAESGPTVIMVCGVNGAGKTTSIAKLAHLLKSEGKSIVLAIVLAMEYIRDELHLAMFLVGMCSSFRGRGFGWVRILALR